MSETQVAASARGATLLILLQISSRALTFALNQILLRFLSPQLLGVAVQLDLYCISVLYFSRDGLRVALQRRADGGLQAVVNLAYLAPVAGFPIAFLLAQLYQRTNIHNVPNLIPSLYLYALAALLELLSEPAFVAAQYQLSYKTRATAEASATVLKTFATVGMVLWASRNAVDLGVLPFAVGQMAYATSLIAVYTYQMTRTLALHGASINPARIKDSKGDYIMSLFHRPLLSLAMSMSVQSGFKYLLTQGDSLLIATLTSLSEQGAYALASNYGGLLARMLFQPIEEASRNLFAKLCVVTDENAAKKPAVKTSKDDRISRDIAADISLRSDAILTLTRILHVYSLLSLFSTTLGPHLAPLILPFIAGKHWSSTDAGKVLGAYAYYIPLMAINGVTEAFVSAVANKSQLATQSIAMAAISLAGFALPAYLLVNTYGLGAKGIVFANCVNMALRIVFNVRFIRRFFDASGAEDASGVQRSKFRVSECMPTMSSVAAAMAVPLVLRGTQDSLVKYGVIGEVARTGIVGLGLGLVVIWSEWRFLHGLYADFIQQKTPGEKKAL